MWHALKQTPNGEVEGPDDHVGKASRARNGHLRPRRQTDHASRPPPTIVRPHAPYEQKSVNRVLESAFPVKSSTYIHLHFTAGSLMEKMTAQLWPQRNLAVGVS